MDSSPSLGASPGADVCAYMCVYCFALTIPPLNVPIDICLCRILARGQLIGLRCVSMLLMSVISFMSNSLLVLSVSSPGQPCCLLYLPLMLIRQLCITLKAVQLKYDEWTFWICSSCYFVSSDMFYLSLKTAIIYCKLKTWYICDTRNRWIHTNSLTRVITFKVPWVLL